MINALLNACNAIVTPLIATAKPFAAIVPLDSQRVKPFFLSNILSELIQLSVAACNSSKMLAFFASFLKSTSISPKSFFMPLYLFFSASSSNVKRSSKDSFLFLGNCVSRIFMNLRIILLPPLSTTSRIFIKPLPMYLLISPSKFLLISLAVFSFVIQLSNPPSTPFIPSLTVLNALVKTVFSCAICCWIAINPCNTIVRLVNFCNDSSRSAFCPPNNPCNPCPSEAIPVNPANNEVIFLNPFDVPIILSIAESTLITLLLKRVISFCIARNSFEVVSPA